MGSGYHSRSPEELRKYLQSLNMQPRKRPWAQYIIFVNIIGIMFLMFILFQDKSLGLGVSFIASNKIQINELETYFVRSNESTPETVNYYIFVKNSLVKENIFPIEEMQILFTLTTDEREECLQKQIDFRKKNIEPMKTEFFSFVIEEPEIKRTETCDTFFHKITTKGFRNFFSRGNRKFTPELNIIYKNQIYRMSIPN